MRKPSAASLAAALVGAATGDLAQAAPAADEARFRAIYKEMI